MTAPVVIRKGDQAWTFPADHPRLDQLLVLAPKWGCTIIDTDAETPSIVDAVSPFAKEVTKMHAKPKQIIKTALAGEAIDQSTLMRAVQARASKSFPDDSEPVAFRKFCDAHPEVLQVLKAAPPAPATAPPTTSFGIIAEQALKECRERGVPLPEHSPYRKYLLAKSEMRGERDAIDGNFSEQASKAVKAVAQGLVDNGKFSDLSTAIRFMRSSPTYAGLFSAGPKYAEAIRGMLDTHLA